MPVISVAAVCSAALTHSDREINSKSSLHGLDPAHHFNVSDILSNGNNSQSAHHFNADILSKRIFKRTNFNQLWRHRGMKDMLHIHRHTFHEISPSPRLQRRSTRDMGLSIIHKPHPLYPKSSQGLDAPFSNIPSSNAPPVAGEKSDKTSVRRSHPLESPTDSLHAAPFVNKPLPHGSPYPTDLSITDRPRPVGKRSRPPDDVTECSGVVNVTRGVGRVVLLSGQRCLKKCAKDADCKGRQRRCACDGACGLSCVRTSELPSSSFASFACLLHLLSILRLLVPVLVLLLLLLLVLLRLLLCLLLLVFSILLCYFFCVFFCLFFQFFFCFFYCSYLCLFFAAFFVSSVVCSFVLLVRSIGRRVGPGVVRGEGHVL